MAGRSSTAAAGAALFNIWNPSAAIRVRLAELSVVANVAPVASAALVLRRTTARGTPASTVTPDIDNDIQRMQTPTSGLLLDLSVFSVAPTIDTSELFRWTFAAVAGSGLMIPLEISIPNGTGLAAVSVAAFTASDISVAWREEF
jgi:hypothetical protein